MSLLCVRVRCFPSSRRVLFFLCFPFVSPIAAIYFYSLASFFAARHDEAEEAAEHIASLLPFFPLSLSPTLLHFYASFFRPLAALSCLPALTLFSSPIHTAASSRVRAHLACTPGALRVLNVRPRSPCLTQNESSDLNQHTCDACSLARVRPALSNEGQKQRARCILSIQRRVRPSVRCGFLPVDLPSGV